jgi:hypothetical protein
MNYRHSIASYARLLAKSGYSKNNGKTLPYTSSSGHKFSLLNRNGGLGRRCGKERLENNLESLM